MIAVPDSIQQDAEWFAENNARFWQTSRRVREFTADNGPIQLEDGRRVGMFADGVDYDVDAVAEIAPGLVSRMAVTFEGSVENIERTISVVMEELPEFGGGFSIKRTLDRAALTGMLRTGSETAEKLKACKTEKAKLQVKA